MKTWNSIYGLLITSRSRCERENSRLRHWIQTLAGRTLILAYLTGVLANNYAAENEQSEEAPDLEFLEFLGQFETDAGEWIDPDSLRTVEFTELLDVSNVDESSDTDDAENDKQ